ncbi:putative DNA-binding transcriptional regulator AlpA [Paraburkholderia sp. UCT70]|uniref:helix-turn-helix transcriptional regulator n=1 Tax=Paraburkholderia sp. UCT70 TaxID=2991068 RepID=UPI003D26063C
MYKTTCLVDIELRPACAPKNGLMCRNQRRRPFRPLKQQIKELLVRGVATARCGTRTPDCGVYRMRCKAFAGGLVYSEPVFTRPFRYVVTAIIQSLQRGVKTMTEKSRGAYTMPAEGLIRADDVAKVLSIGLSTLHAWCAIGRFPKAVQIGPQAARWNVKVVRQWIEERSGGAA